MGRRNDLSWRFIMRVSDLFADIVKTLLYTIIAIFGLWFIGQGIKWINQTTIEQRSLCVRELRQPAVCYEKFK